MKNKKTQTPADVADRHRQFMAFGMLAVGLIYLSKMTEHLIDSSAVQQYLEIFQVAMALTSLGFFSPALFWKFRHRSTGERYIYFSKDGFAAEALNTAQRASFVLSFLMLAFLESSGKLLNMFPSKFFLELTLATLLITMSVVYLIKTWPENGFELEEGNASHA